MKFALLMIAMSVSVAAHADEVGYRSPQYNPDNYYIDYYQASEKGKSLIVYENKHTGRVMKFLVKDSDMTDDEAIRAIKIKVAEEDATN